MTSLRQDPPMAGDTRTPPADDSLNILILCDFRFRHIGTVRDHLQSFRKYSRHRITVAHARSVTPTKTDLNAFDVVVLHYSLVISLPHYIRPQLAAQLRAYGGYKVLFIQDEYRWVDRTAGAMADLGVHLLYTVINPEVIDRIYHHPEIRKVRRKATLTGYVPEELLSRPVPAYGDRPVDVGYRARRLPGWLGAFAQEKWRIGERFRTDAPAHGLTCDIAFDEASRLYGEDWISFVSNCKAVLGTESGASFIDFDGTVQPAVEAYENLHPNAAFAEIEERFLQGRDGDIVISVISPRIFEAAALRTLMILYPGSYSNILEPWRHYVPLDRDHGNMDEVVDVLRDPERAGAIIDRAHREIAHNPAYTFRAMVEEFDDDLVRALRDQPALRIGARPLTAREITALEERIERHARWERKWHAIDLKVRRAVYVTIVTLLPRPVQNRVLGTIRWGLRKLGR